MKQFYSKLFFGQVWKKNFPSFRQWLEMVWSFFPNVSGKCLKLGIKLLRFYREKKYGIPNILPRFVPNFVPMLLATGRDCVKCVECRLLRISIDWHCIQKEMLLINMVLCLCFVCKFVVTYDSIKFKFLILTSISAICFSQNKRIVPVHIQTHSKLVFVFIISKFLFKLLGFKHVICMICMRFRLLTFYFYIVSYIGNIQKSPN